MGFPVGGFGCGPAVGGVGGVGCGPGGNLGAVLVLFILLVIILRTICF